MDVDKNLEILEKELNKLLTNREFGGYKRWKKVDGEEIMLDIPAKDLSSRKSFWRHFSLSPPKMRAKEVAQFIKSLGIKS